MSHSSARAYRELRAAILSGAYPAGERLREERLASCLGFSRTPVREALHRLATDGLVRLQPNRGAEVVGWSEADLEELFELRVLLEGRAARRAAEQGTADLDGMRERCTAMEAYLEAPDENAYDEITRLNLEFHRAVHQGTGDRLLPDLLNRVIDVPMVRHTFHEYSCAELQRSFSQHRELVEAIAVGDGKWAQAVMHTHIRAARAALRGSSGTAKTDGEGKPQP